MCEAIMVVLSLLFFFSNIDLKRRDIPRKLSGSAALIFWGSVFVFYMCRYTPVMIAGCILGCIAITMYKIASTDKMGIDFIIILVADFAHKILVSYGMIKGDYAFALLSTVVLYAFAIIIGFFVGYMSQRNKDKV